MTGECPHGHGEMFLGIRGDPLEPEEPYCPECSHIQGNDCDDGCNFEPEGWSVYGDGVPAGYGHGVDLQEVEPHIVFDTAYSPLKCTYMHRPSFPSSRVSCDNCEWGVQTSELPKDDAGCYILPDQCPECVREEELGFLRER